MKKFILLLSIIAMSCPQVGTAQQLQKIISQNGSFRKDTIFSITDGKQQLEIPVSVIKGKKQGPVFTVVAGIHGFEYPPIIAVQQLLSEIKPEKLSGTLIVLPLVNLPGFYERTPFLNPQDKKNPNKSFPGNPKGTMTERMADWVTKEVISQSDVFLDIHGGDANEDLLPFVCYYESKENPKQTALAKRLSEVSDFEYVVSYPYALKNGEPSLYAFKEAVQQGKAALSLEAGRLGSVESECVSEIKSGIYNMLAELQLYEAPKVSDNSKKQRVYLDRQVYVRVPQRGIFYTNRKSGDSVKKGDNLGYITDVFGKKIADVTSPENGIILYNAATPPVNPGETLFCIGLKSE